MLEKISPIGLDSTFRKDGIHFEYVLLLYECRHSRTCKYLQDHDPSQTSLLLSLELRYRLCQLASKQDQFRSGNIDFASKPVDKDGNEVPKKEAKYFEMVDGPNHTYKCDYEAIGKVEERIQNGFRLFGKYYQGLWD